MQPTFKLWHLMAGITLCCVLVFAVDRHLHETKLNMRIEDLGLSVRATNCLFYADIETIRELIQRNEDELLMIRNFGQTTLVEIQAMLKDKGLRLRRQAEK